MSVQSQCITSTDHCVAGCRFGRWRGSNKIHGTAFRRFQRQCNNSFILYFAWNFCHRHRTYGPDANVGPLDRLSIGDQARCLLFCNRLHCLSVANRLPVHIAFIPLLIPPLLKLMNKMGLDRRAVSTALGFGLTAPYVSLPIGFGLIFQGIVAQSMTNNGMNVTVSDVASVAWIAGLSMFIGLAVSIFFYTRRPRHYENLPAIGVSENQE